MYFPKKKAGARAAYFWLNKGKQFIDTFKFIDI